MYTHWTENINLTPVHCWGLIPSFAQRKGPAFGGLQHVQFGNPTAARCRLGKVNTSRTVSRQYRSGRNQSIFTSVFRARLGPLDDTTCPTTLLTMYHRAISINIESCAPPNQCVTTHRSSIINNAPHKMLHRDQASVAPTESKSSANREGSHHSQQPPH